MDARHARLDTSARASGDAWLRRAHARIDRSIERLLMLPDEEQIDGRWSRARAAVRAYATRPAKRVRPLLVVVGYRLARPRRRPPRGLWDVAAALELLHTFLLVHDDVADGADLRRGGPALHRLVGGGRRGEDLAIVLGDHLFARAMECMLAAGLPRAADVARYWLGVCRTTAAGQFLDLDLTGAPLASVTLFQTLKVALHKTARYTFVAPLVGGAMLGGAPPALCAALDRLGRQVGIAFQLRDDLLGLFGSAARTGKPVGADLLAGKPTFPVIAAYLRAPAPARSELERLWVAARHDAGARADLLAAVDAHGGRAAAERAVDRATRAARRGLAVLPVAPACRALLDDLVTDLAVRTA